MKEIRCPRCNGILVGIYFLGQTLDFLACEKCRLAYDPKTMKTLARVI